MHVEYFELLERLSKPYLYVYAYVWSTVDVKFLTSFQLSKLSLRIRVHVKYSVSVP